MMVIENVVNLKGSLKLNENIYQKCYDIINLIILVFEKSLNLSNYNIIHGINLILNELKISFDNKINFLDFRLCKINE
jgi:hypothetical protein